MVSSFTVGFLIATNLFCVAPRAIGQADATESSAAETCALCHEQETKEWQASPHARAITGNFSAVWEQQGKKWECLVCHTSHYDRKTGALKFGTRPYILREARARLDAKKSTAKAEALGHVAP
jgi:hypothetical protein